MLDKNDSVMISKKPTHILFGIKLKLEKIPNPNEIEARTLRTINDEINTRTKDGIL
tara:strand:+ start:77 stop:244 length:168 start_codon:yes stop_codon:yes gene_type:complete